MLTYISKNTFARVGGTLARNQNKISALIDRHLTKRNQSLKNQNILSQESQFYNIASFKMMNTNLIFKEFNCMDKNKQLLDHNKMLEVLILLQQCFCNLIQNCVYFQNDIFYSNLQSQSVVLGGLNKLQLKEYQDGKQIYKSEPVLENNESDLPAKEILTHFFQEDLEFGTQWFYQQEDNCVYRVINSTRQAIMEDHLSCGLQLHKKENRHLLFGKPDLNLVFEDLALRLSLKQLQDVFYHCVQLVSEDIQNNQDQRYPYFENERIYDMFRVKVRQVYQDLLLEKSILYTSSIFKKTARVFKKSAIIVPNEITKKVAMQTLEPMSPEWNQIFRAYIDNEKDKDFFVADKFSSKKYSRSFRNIKRYFKDDPDYNIIMKAAEKQSSKFDYYSKERPLFDRIKEQDIDSDEILEKYVIINQLLEKSTQFYLESGVNPFNKSIFHGLFKEKYGKDEESVKYILQDYEKLNYKYSLELHKIQNQQIKRIGEYDLVWRPQLEQFSKTVQRIEEKPENYNYEFAIGQINRDKRDRIVETILLKTMIGLLRQREKSGISQSDQIVHLKEYFEGKRTQENVRIYNNLILEANHTLGSIVKFPKIYKQFLPYLVNLRKYQIMKSIEHKLDEIEEQVKFDKKLKLQNLTNAMSVEAISAKRNAETGNKQNIDFDEEEEKIENFKELFENFQDQMFVLGDNPDQIPFDVKGKTLHELEEMGFQASGQLEFQVDELGNIQGIESEESQELMTFLNQLRQSDANGDKEYEDIGKMREEDFKDEDSD